ncbi:hypothetical protein D1872_285210 [compost metagenome]
MIDAADVVALPMVTDSVSRLLLPCLRRMLAWPVTPAFSWKVKVYTAFPSLSAVAAKVGLYP